MEGGVFARSWPAAGADDAGGLAVVVGVEARGHFRVAVGEAAAVGDVAEVLAGVGRVGAVECDGGLGGGLEGEKEKGEEEDCLREHGEKARFVSPLQRKVWSYFLDGCCLLSRKCFIDIDVSI